MGLLRGIARTAVVAGTATAVSNNVSRRQQARWDRRAYDEEQPAPSGAPDEAAAAAPTYAPAPAPTPAAGEDVVGEIERLGALKQQGLLTDAEFAAAKAKLLGA
ncbi:MAG: SHOCT domain-containing protein [Acidimicrobiia bacterium]|nr:SHOCT domain-containing protein [Acidimicrobiia bacterium]